LSSILIIIPVYNEASTIENFVQDLNNRISEIDKAEIIFVDKGSQDGTVNKLLSFNANVITLDDGNYLSRLNKVVENSKGNALFFGRTESIPPFGFDILIEERINKGQALGCFRIIYDSMHLLLAILAWFTRFPFLLCRGVNGNFFIKKSLFKQIGGFDNNQSAFHDLDLIKRAKKLNRFVVIQETMIKSDFRYKKYGVIPSVIKIVISHFMYNFGFSHPKLRSFYEEFIR
jgi:glycosyltransferase involved in cell wall biosynthesis